MIGIIVQLAISWLVVWFFERSNLTFWAFIRLKNEYLISLLSFSERHLLFIRIFYENVFRQ